MPAKKLRIAINGLGRIGRVFLRIAWGDPAFEIVAANSRSEAEVYAHLIKYDSTYGVWEREIKPRKGKFLIDGKPLPFFRKQFTSELPWRRVRPDIVVDATGHFRSREDLAAHQKAGARYTVVTAPLDDADVVLVDGVNEKSFDPGKHRIISAASCTSVCASLVMKVLAEKFSVRTGYINTVHAFTSDQSLQDSAHQDLRRARAATQSIIPTTSGVSKVLGKLFPKLSGKFAALAYRVPVIDPSVLSITAELGRKTNLKALKQAFAAASRKDLRGRLSVSDIPLVSRDYQQNPYGAIVDLVSTDLVDGRLANVVAWYDNEWGYVTRVVSLLKYLGKRIN